MNISWMDLRDARQLRSWTQAQLAEELGVHQKTVANWEMKGVPPRQAYKVQRVLGEELRYVDHRQRSGDPNLSFDDYKQIFLDREAPSADDRDRMEADFRRRAADLGMSPDEYAEALRDDSDYQVEQQQAAYDERLAVRDALAKFSNDALLAELKERFRDLEQGSH
ncbi:helix-turn-helix domain-containing protein [Curtobacterium flaccumfaciens pv. beticola]|uniref:helix-turn-helix transcriptional regulator n=1 Tax=Curtobacterium flaccumfaciens TaxID=2035 RepID=UPI00349FBBBF|nr:helix-turn-helix domain-containing protein [Curtobacterium flaccumfaciens pv. basellae]